MKKRARFAVALISGLGAGVTVFTAAPTLHRPAGSDLLRMRGDVQRVGATMRSVIQREHGRRQASQAAS